MIAEIVEKVPVLADALLQPGALHRREDGDDLPLALRLLRLAHETNCTSQLDRQLPRVPRSHRFGRGAIATASNGDSHSEVQVMIVGGRSPSPTWSTGSMLGRSAKCSLPDLRSRSEHHSHLAWRETYSSRASRLTSANRLP